MPRTRAVVALCLTAALAMSGLSATQAAPDRRDLDAARDRLMELEREFELVVERYNLVSEQLTSLQRRIAVVTNEVRAIERRMAAKEDSAIAVAVTLYKSGATGSLEAVLSSESLAEMETRLTYLSESEKANARIFEQLTVDRTELNARVAELEAAEARAARTRAELNDLRADIEAKVASQRDEIASLNEAIERAEARRRARAAAARRAAARAAARAAQPQPAPAPAPAPEVPNVTASNPNAQVAVDAALSQVGKPYQWGAAGPDSYDCSGLTMWAWARAGVALPHNSSMQYAATPRVAREDLQPGDLLFFGSPIHHVGMYIGSGRMVEAPYTGTTVRVVSAARSDYVGAGRPGI